MRVLIYLHWDPARAVHSTETHLRYGLVQETPNRSGRPRTSRLLDSLSGAGVNSRLTIVPGAVLCRPFGYRCRSRWRDDADVLTFCPRTLTNN